MPSFRSSPRIRSAPQSRFSVDHAVDEGDDIGRETRMLDQQQGLAPPTMEAREQHEQASLMDAKARAFDAARGDDELLPENRVLGEELGTRAGQIGDEAARDAGGPARVAEPPHRPGCEPGDHCPKP